MDDDVAHVIILEAEESSEEETERNPECVLFKKKVKQKASRQEPVVSNKSRYRVKIIIKDYYHNRQ